MWRYACNLCLIVTAILWSFAAYEFLYNRNPGGLAVIVMSTLPVLFGAACDEIDRTGR